MIFSSIVSIQHFEKVFSNGNMLYLINKIIIIIIIIIIVHPIARVNLIDIKIIL